MGFLDKAKETLSEATKAAQEGVADMTAKRKADALLRELGAWTYAKQKGGYPEADANIERVIGELRAHEAEHGELGSKDEPAAAAPATATAPPPGGAVMPCSSMRFRRWRSSMSASSARVQTSVTRAAPYRRTRPSNA